MNVRASRIVVSGNLDMTDGVYYLGTPYTKYPRSLVAAFEGAAELAARLLSLGVITYSPIVESHALAQFGHLNPLDLSIWYPRNERLMSRCDGLIVAEMTSWQASAGIAHEIAWFTDNRKPVVYLDPDRLVFSGTPGAVSTPQGERAFG
jgi:hypothetical protein